MADIARGYPLGSAVRLNATFRVGSVATDPDSIALTVRDPAGADTVHAWPPNGVIVKDSVGVFHADVEPAAEGTWLFKWLSDDPIAAVEGRFEVFSAFTPTPTGLQRTYSYDLSTDVGKVRLNVDDRDMTRVGDEVPLERRSCVWSDEEVQAVLDATGGVLRASARLLVVLAGNKQLLVQSRRIASTTVDYGSVRSDLLRQARAFLDDADVTEPVGATTPADGVAEMVHDDFSWRQVLDNQAMREL